MRKYISIILILFLITSCQGGHNIRENVEPGTQADLEANIGDYVLFDLNSTRLDNNATYILNKQAEWLKKYEYIKVVIEGHCDERGTREYNLALGAKRAQVVKNYLVASGVSASRITTISYGKERPIAKGHDEEAWQENRRAATVIN